MTQYWLSTCSDCEVMGRHHRGPVAFLGGSRQLFSNRTKSEQVVRDQSGKSSCFSSSVPSELYFSQPEKFAGDLFGLR